MEKQRNKNSGNMIFYCPRETDDDGKEVNREVIMMNPQLLGMQNDYDAVDQFNDRAWYHQ